MCGCVFWREIGDILNKVDGADFAHVHLAEFFGKGCEGVVVGFFGLAVLIARDEE